jgi:hypothetical protein
MSNYQEGNGPHSEGGPAGGEPQYQEGGQPQGGREYQGGSTAYQGGQPQETSQFGGAGSQQWEHQQGQGYQGGYQGGGYQGGGYQGGYQGGGYQDQGQGHRGGFQGGLPLRSRGGRLAIRSTFKTTEFWAYVVVALAILIAAAVTDEGPDNQGFSAHDAWKYVTWLTIGYLVSRGLTKFGGHERDSDDHHDHDHERR